MKHPITTTVYGSTSQARLEVFQVGNSPGVELTAKILPLAEGVYYARRILKAVRLKTGQQGRIVERLFYWVAEEKTWQGVPGIKKLHYAKLAAEAWVKSGRNVERYREPHKLIAKAEADDKAAAKGPEAKWRRKFGKLAAELEALGYAKAEAGGYLKYTKGSNQYQFPGVVEYAKAA